MRLLIGRFGFIFISCLYLNSNELFKPLGPSHLHPTPLSLYFPDLQATALGVHPCFNSFTPYLMRQHIFLTAQPLFFIADSSSTSLHIILPVKLSLCVTSGCIKGDLSWDNNERVVALCAHCVVHLPLSRFVSMHQLTLWPEYSSMFLWLSIFLNK